MAYKLLSFLFVILLLAAGCQESAGTYVSKGNADLMSKNYSSAIENYTKAIEMDSKNTEAYFQRAKAYHYEERNDEALKDFEKVVQLDPDGKQGETSKQMIDKIKQSR